MLVKVNLAERRVDLDDGIFNESIWFEDLYEWGSIKLNGFEYDVHFCYEPRDRFSRQDEWLRHIVRIYSSIGNETIKIDKIILEL